MQGIQLKAKINELLKGGEYDDILPLLLTHKKTTERDNDLATMCYLCTVYEQEKAVQEPTIFTKVSDVRELLKRYTMLKFYLRRIDFNIMDDFYEFYQFLAQNRVSSYELFRVMNFSVVHKERVLQAINGTLSRNEASDIGGTENCHIQNEGDCIQEICFIICTNDDRFAEECIYYIKHLVVPEDVRVSILTIEDAKSMTAGYNEAMRYSDSKYKVYLHHDTFLVNPYFIQDILKIFRSDAQIGMIGVIGSPQISINGVMWDGQRYGMIYEQHIYETVMLSNPCNRLVEEVEAIDGLLMATQYDIPWREDLFDKWDFYDCSQSMEFRRNGYKVVVPRMKEPWCVHDCGFLNLENYDTEREKFIAEYMKDKRD